MELSEYTKKVIIRLSYLGAALGVGCIVFGALFSDSIFVLMGAAFMFLALMSYSVGKTQVDTN